MLKAIILSLFLFTLSTKAASPSPVEGKQCMAVSSQHYATDVGFNILQQGGNAIDSAVAMGYALAVVHPCCGNIGGGGFMLIRLANGKTTFINFREKAPHRANPTLFIDKKGRVITDYLSGGHITGTLSNPYFPVGVPGTVMGLDYALKKYGTFSRQQVMQPAIHLAETGYTLLPGDVTILKAGEASFKTEPNVSAIFLKNGRSYQSGEKLVQKNLANTLREIADKGPLAFYQGSIAHEIAAASRKNGGLITLTDLKNYTIEEVPPLTCRYRGYQIITTPPPGSGVTICEALALLEFYPLTKLGFHSALSIHYMVEAMRFAFLDRNRYLGDPHFINNPVKMLLSAKHIDNINRHIAKQKATAVSIHFEGDKGSNTTSYVVVDKAGNAVSVTYTLNDYFGAKVIPGKTGFFLNNELSDFTIKPGVANNYGLVQGPANLIAPDKRPLSSMAPTMLLKNNRLFMIIGTPGGSTIPTQLIDVILNVIHYDMDIQEAEDSPRIHMQAYPDTIFVEPYAVSPDSEKILRKMGYTFHLGSPYGTLLWGAVSGILIDPKTQMIYGAIDSRRSSGSAKGK